MAFSLKSNNPALRSDPFAANAPLTLGGTMTIDGTINKTGLLMICVAIPAVWTWNLVRGGDVSEAMGLLLVGAIGGLITAFVTVWKKQWSAFTAPLYALLEGLVLGGLSALFEAKYPGIAINAVILTIGTLVVLLLAYRAGILRASEGFKRIVFAATGGIALLYLVTIVLGFFGIQIPQIYAAGPIGIGFSLVVVVIAALNLVLDFDLIETGAKQGAPAYMEWYGAFALMVTLIWLYMEIIRLLSKLRSRR